MHEIFVKFANTNPESMKQIIYITLSIFLISCGSTKIFIPTQVDADRGAAKYPGLTLASLEQGRSLFEQYCTQCHGAKSPQMKDSDAWHKTVPRMAKKSEGKDSKNFIDAEKQKVILQYLVTMSTVPKPSK